MIICRTPFRVSLFGGGTDYPPWYEKHGGAVLGFAIDKYCYISVRKLPPFFEHKHRIVYSKVENVVSVDDIKHPAVRGVLSQHQLEDGLEIHHDGDLPARSGLGSSSSFTVGMLNALAAFQGRIVSKRHLAREAIRIEQDIINEKVGCQDQIWAAYGGLNRINFLQTGEFDVQPAIVSNDRRSDLQDHLMLVFTGITRLAPAMAEKQMQNLDAREAQLKEMMAMVDEAQSILHDARSSISDVGVLLHQSWLLKRELAEGVSNPVIDEIYNAATGAGASGGKLLGAGGGGFMLFYFKDNKKKNFLKKNSKLLNIPFNFSQEGSEIIFNHTK